MIFCDISVHFYLISNSCALKAVSKYIYVSDVPLEIGIEQGTKQNPCLHGVDSFSRGRQIMNKQVNMEFVGRQ